MPPMRSPELSFGKKVGLALLTVSTLVACGPSPEVSARATNLALGSLENQPKPEATAAPIQSSFLEPTIAVDGDYLRALHHWPLYLHPK